MGASQSGPAQGPKLEPRVQEPKLVLASDLDHTMVEHNEPSHSALLAFNDSWMCNFHRSSLLVFSTGRSMELFLQLQKEAPLLSPDVVVCSVGTEVYLNTPDGFVPDTEWSASLDKGWDASVAKELGQEFEELELQQESEQRPHKVSFKISVTGEDADLVVESLREKVQSQLEAIVIFSGGADVDILPKEAGKGKALKHLLDQLEGTGDYPTDGILVAGDSGNDIELFQVPGVQGCIVGNAQAELCAWIQENPSNKFFEATQDCAGGILESLNYFEKFSDDPRDQCELVRFVLQSFSSEENFLSSLQSGVEIIDADGKKRKGETAALTCWESPSSIRWLDQLEVTSLETSWLATFHDWRSSEDGKDGFAVSGLVTTDAERFCWQFLHFTNIK